jgi:hypothetical protein
MRCPQLGERDCTPIKTEKASPVSASEALNLSCCCVSNRSAANRATTTPPSAKRKNEGCLSIVKLRPQVKQIPTTAKSTLSPSLQDCPAEAREGASQRPSTRTLRGRAEGVLCRDYADPRHA